MNNQAITAYWQEALAGDQPAYDALKQHYKHHLTNIRPLYSDFTDDYFNQLVELSVDKALERGLRFRVENFESYMLYASQTYFKYNALGNNQAESLNIPLELVKAFAKLEEVYQLVPQLAKIDEQRQIDLISHSFEYPIFSTRLLYYSYKKLTEDTLRQLDIDLCVALLPAPQRLEWEILYEKDAQQIKESIETELAKE
jgi:hypothetical protein